MDGDDLIDELQRRIGLGWRPSAPATEAEITEAERELGLSLTPCYRRLLAYSNGGTINVALATVDLFSIRDLLEFNPDPEWTPELPGMLIFAGDCGDYVFYFDPEGRLKRGVWAVFAVEMGVVGFDFSRHVAADLESLVGLALRGDDPLAGRYAKDDTPGSVPP